WTRYFARQRPAIARGVRWELAAPEAHDGRIAELDRISDDWLAISRESVERGLAASMELARRERHTRPDLTDGRGPVEPTRSQERQLPTPFAELARYRRVLGRDRAGHQRVDALVQSAAG